MNDHIKKQNNLAGAMLGIYLGVAPVYWFPGLTQANIIICKYLIILAGIVLTWSSSIKMQKTVIPKGMAGPIGFVILILSCWSGFFQSELDTIYNKIIDFLMGYLLIWTIYVFIKCKGSIQRVMLISVCITSCLVFLTITSYLFGIPDWRSPLVYDSKQLWIAGFGAERTGWSNALSFYPAAVFFSFGNFSKNSHFRYWLCLFLFILILGSQLISGGRAGFFASLIVVICLLYIKFPKKYLLILVLASIILVIFKGYYFTDHLRINRLNSYDISNYNIDRFSAGRITLCKAAVGLIKNRSVFGYGFERIEFTILGAKDVHNIWLKMAVESGLLYPAVFLVFVCSVFLNLKRKMVNEYSNAQRCAVSWNITEKNTNILVLTAILFVGLFLSQFEPNMLVGSFQLSAYWWMACGAAYAI